MVYISNDNFNHNSVRFAFRIFGFTSQNSRSFTSSFFPTDHFDNRGCKYEDIATSAFNMPSYADSNLIRPFRLRRLANGVSILLQNKDCKSRTINWHVSVLSRETVRCCAQLTSSVEFLLVTGRSINRIMAFKCSLVASSVKLKQLGTHTITLINPQS